jgi:hypothetical protein
MERKEFLKGALSSLTLLSVAGCLTAKLYEPREDDETALSFLVTKMAPVPRSYHSLIWPMTTRHPNAERGT